MQTRFAELAKLEFDEARAWCRDIRTELGSTFAAEVHGEFSSQRLAPLIPT
jgi:hypothetical protein